MRKSRYILDTTALISYFNSVFEEKPKISDYGLNIIEEGFKSMGRKILVIPSIVFVEIFEKWIRNEESQEKIRSEMLEPIKQAPNIEIRPIDIEVLEIYIKLDDADIKLESHDRLILASAVALESPLITSDRKLIKYVAKNPVVPRIIQ